MKELEASGGEGGEADMVLRLSVEGGGGARESNSPFPSTPMGRRTIGVEIHPKTGWLLFHTRGSFFVGLGLGLDGDSCLRFRSVI